MPFKQNIASQRAEGGQIQNVQAHQIGGARPVRHDVNDNIEFEQNFQNQISSSGGSIQNISAYHIHHNYFDHQHTAERNVPAAEGVGRNMAQAAPANDASKTDAAELTKALNKLRNLNATVAHDVLRKNLMYLCKNIDTKNGLLTQMKELGAIGDVSAQAIEQAHTMDFKKNEALIDFIRKGDESRFSKFLDALITTEHEHVVIVLASSLGA